MKQLLLILTLCCVTFPAISQDTIFVRDDFKIYSDYGNKTTPLCYYIDTSGTLTLKDIFKKQFQNKISEIKTNNKPTNNSNWYKLIVKNSSNRFRHFYLQVIYPVSDNTIMSLYDTTIRGCNVVKCGNSLPDSLQNINIGISDAVTFDLDLDETKTLYLNICSNNKVKEEQLDDPILSLKIGSIDKWNQKNLLKRVYQGIALGFLLLMFIYHLILFFKVRLKEYLAFSFYAISAALFFSFRMKFGYEIIGFENHSIGGPLVRLCFFSFLILALFFENIKDTHKKSYRIILIGAIGIFISFLFGVSQLIISNSSNWFDSLKMIFGITILLLSFFTVIYTLFPYILLAIKGNKPSKYFLIANSFFIVSFIFYLLKDTVIIGNGLKTFTSSALEIGFAGQMLIFAIGLADKMRSTLKEKNESQKELINQLQVNAELQEKVNRELEQKVKERTLEIEQQKEEIITQSEEITSQRDLLFLQNKNITDSIEYASFIQQAMLTSQEVLNSCELSNFILYCPRDIVSGDFYWFKQVKNYVYIVAADCTGHGVPGAFMSVLGISLLNEIAGKRDLNSPATVLNEMRKKLKKSLKQDEPGSASHDGMDISICLLDMETKQLQFAGAFNPLLVVRKGELIEYPADRMPVGVHPKDTVEFTNHEIQLESNDALYIFSDGFSSQFGGKDGKQFTRKRFKQVLLEIYSAPMEIQKQLLLNRLNEWRADFEQVDDILVIGISIA